MSYIIFNHLGLISTFLVIILLGIFLIVTAFKINTNKKFINVILGLLGIATITIGTYGLFFMVFLGFNS